MVKLPAQQLDVLPFAYVSLLLARVELWFDWLAMTLVLRLTMFGPSKIAWLGARNWTTLSSNV